jgi:hypothetical protein
MLTMGAVDFGRAYFSYTTIANAAREGALCAARGILCPTTAAAAVNAEIGAALAGGVTTTVTGSATPGQGVTVTVQHNFTTVTTAILGTRTFPIRASATMVRQCPPAPSNC